VQNKKPTAVKAPYEKGKREDFEKYREMAIELGASDAKVIPAEKVYVDNRVRAKCTVPKCPKYGVSAHCPPHTLKADEIRDIVQGYGYALLVKMEIDSSVIAAKDPDEDEGGVSVGRKKASLELLGHYRKLTDIVTQVESQAFYDGYYLSVAFSAGSCHAVFCNNQDCLVLKNEPCRHPLRSRPSMEASSMNVYRMVAEAGWNIYPIGVDCMAADVPHGTLVGLVLLD